jgi:sugar phosphate isomerase/epimerase
MSSDLIILATNWGYAGDIISFCQSAKTAGYDGIEVWVPGSNDEMNMLSQSCTSKNLKLGLLAGGSSSNFEEHRSQYYQSLERGIKLNPIYINCHTGRDYFTFDQNVELIQHAIKMSKESGIPIYHETHRGRALFAAHITRNFIEKINELTLTLDISHWCNVHESLLADQKETVEIALNHTEHIHARVGYAEGPQVNDPRAPEWNEAVKTHFSWWEKIFARKRSEGKPITILTEFGPADYMHTLPFTNQPVSDQWAINVHMMKELRKKFGNK